MIHEPDCRSNCPCCAVDWDCTCGATHEMEDSQKLDTPTQQQIEHINFTHDPLCPWYGRYKPRAYPCDCQLIARVREDERRRWDGQSVVLASTIKQEGEQG